MGLLSPGCPGEDRGMRASSRDKHGGNVTGGCDFQATHLLIRKMHFLLFKFLHEAPISKGIFLTFSVFLMS